MAPYVSSSPRSSAGSAALAAALGRDPADIEGLQVSATGGLFGGRRRLEEQQQIEEHEIEEHKIEEHEIEEEGHGKGRAARHPCVRPQRDATRRVIRSTSVNTA